MGREALLRIKQQGIKRTLAGFLETSIELGDVADKDANGRTAPVNQRGADDAPALVLDETALPPHPERAAEEGR